jgi:hypothetical protein
MNPERWRQITELFHAAFERAPENRQQFLEDACRDDADLRLEVETLLAHREQAGSFLETPALPIPPATSSAKAVVGRQFGPYRILSPLGLGGMGEVYQAHDSKLGRDVAIKTLPPEFARDPDRLTRFRREARALATLNHQNIAAIYGLEESDNMDYLVLELVEGETLAELIQRTGPLAVDEALNYARQIAEGLEAAHGKGIIHRDLKPANVKVTPEKTATSSAVYNCAVPQYLQKPATASHEAETRGVAPPQIDIARVAPASGRVLEQIHAGDSERGASNGQRAGQHGAVHEAGSWMRRAVCPSA